MKKLLFILLLPVFSFAQSYEDLITITDLQIFKKVLSENYYEKHSNIDSLVVYSYFKELDSLGNEKARRWAHYDTRDGFWQIQINDRNILFDVYEDIYNDAQKYCEFKSVVELSDTVDVSWYRCNDIVLGFNLDDGSGVIRSLPVPKTLID